MLQTPHFFINMLNLGAQKKCAQCYVLSQVWVTWEWIVGEIDSMCKPMKFPQLGWIWGFLTCFFLVLFSNVGRRARHYG